MNSMKLQNFLRSDCEPRRLLPLFFSVFPLQTFLNKLESFHICFIFTPVQDTARNVFFPTKENMSRKQKTTLHICFIFTPVQDTARSIFFPTKQNMSRKQKMSLQDYAYSSG